MFWLIKEARKGNISDFSLNSISLNWHDNPYSITVGSKITTFAQN